MNEQEQMVRNLKAYMAGQSIAKWFQQVILIGVALALIVGAVVMLIWDYLVPDLFGGPEITYWQAVWLTYGVRLLATNSR